MRPARRENSIFINAGSKTFEIAMAPEAIRVPRNRLQALGPTLTNNPKHVIAISRRTDRCIPSRRDSQGPIEAKAPKQITGNVVRTATATDDRCRSPRTTESTGPTLATAGLEFAAAMPIAMTSAVRVMGLARAVSLRVERIEPPDINKTWL